MLWLDWPIFGACPDQLFHDFSSQRTLHLELLLHRGQRRIVEGGAGNVIESDHGAIFGHAAAGFGHRANGGAGGEIVKRNQGSEIGPAAHEFFGQFAGFRVSGISALNFQDKPGVELQPHLLGKTFKPVPPLHAVDQNRGSFDEGNVAVPKVVQMLKRLPCPRCIIHNHRTYRDIS